MVILIVDDDVELCGLLTEYLSNEGYEVVCAHNGHAGLRHLLDTPYDIVVLDVMLPGMDGFEVLRQARVQSDVPVLLLTARGGQDDRLEGFEAGADDYLPKPFAAEELLARVKAITRRAQGGRMRRPTELRVGPLRLAPISRDAWNDDTKLDLTATEFNILELLMRAAGRVVSRDEIFGALYQREASTFERSLDVHVSHLRKKLGAKAGDLVRTVRGVGYLLSASE